MQREIIRPQLDTPVVIKLDFGPEGVEKRSQKTGDLEYMYTVNDDAGLIYLPPQTRNELIRTQAQAGDYIQILKSKRQPGRVPGPGPGRLARGSAAASSSAAWNPDACRSPNGKRLPAEICGPPSPRKRFPPNRSGSRRYRSEAVTLQGHDPSKRWPCTASSPRHG